MNRKLLIVLASGLLVLSILACSFSKGTPTPVTQPTLDKPVNPDPVNPQPPDNAVEILATSTLTDEYGGFYVFGEVKNNSDTALTSIELFVEILDANGATLLKDENGNPMQDELSYPLLSTIGAGESSPFSYYFDTNNGMPATYTVSVGTYQVDEAVRAELEAVNVATYDDGSGYFYLSGELVNKSDQWVHINGLTGGVLDTAGTVISADWTGTYTTLLAPAGNQAGRDRTPFSVSFPTPSTTPDQWSLWWDSEIATDVVDYDMAVQVTNSYFDEYGSFHLVGMVTNNTDKPLSSLVVIGLYDAEGLCLDADYVYLSYPVQPGQSVPFDASYFSAVNYSEDLAAQVSSYTVQLDPWNTYEPYYNNVALNYDNQNIQQDGAYWTVSGTFTNTSDKNLTGVTVVSYVYDAENTLIGMNYTYIYPEGEFFAPGSTSEYEIWLYLDPNANLASYVADTLIFGDYSE